MESDHLASNREYDYEWRLDANCRDLNPDLFYPKGNTGKAGEQTRNAKAVCAECIVRSECLMYALETKQEHGIWGGTDEEERRLIQKNRRAREQQAM